MKKFWNAIVRNPKKAILAGVLAIVGLLPIVSNAWGPGRPTFTIEKPANYVVFNSITNNPSNGDERNFVRIKEAGTTNKFTNEVNIAAGKTYTIYIYYHNNAAANYNLVATNTRVNTQLPSSVKANVKTDISAKIMADNANPKTVWDEARVTATEDVVLKYVSNSATIHSKGAVNGKKLNSNEFLTNGALIGYNALDGRVQGCHQYAGYITYDFVVEAVNKPDFTVAKTVSLGGKKQYSEVVSTTDNQVVDFKIVYTNTGNTRQTDVIIKDVLPTGLTYIKGSTKLANQSTGGKWQSVSDNIGTTGINIGNYAAGGNAYVMFSARINDFDCNKRVEITNYAQAITRDGTKSDSAKVIAVTEACPVIVRINVCRLSDKKIVTINESDFDAKKYSKNLKDCDPVAPVRIQVCRLSDKKIITINESDFDTKKYSKNLKDCDPVAPVRINVCRLSDKKIITINESDFDAKKYSKDLTKCDEVAPVRIQVCRLSDKKIITINESDFDAKKYSKDLTKCDEVAPVRIQVCRLSDKKIININESDFDAKKYSKDLTKCDPEIPAKHLDVCRLSDKTMVTILETEFDASLYSKNPADCDPEIPEELPVTGPAETLNQVIGLGSLVASIGYYITSRRMLIK
jgi:uncharacterized repeat protein (TIGR01451 family)